MSVTSQNDWNPETYARFRGLRLRPAIDLIQQIAAVPAGDVVDLGCGAGAVGDALGERFNGHRIIGVDSSEAMLVKAAETRSYDDLVHADIAHWQPARAPAVVFSNAALNWLNNHDRLLPRLAGYLAPGGILAFQVPGQHDAPSHALAREVAVRRFPAVFGTGGWNADVLTPAEYHAILSPSGAVNVWETSYCHCLAPVEEGHPVRAFTQSTYLRPILDRLDDAQQADYLATYDAALAQAYPLRADGSVLFPFRRVFAVVVT